MIPVGVAQLVGSVELLPEITGVGFTTTVALPGKDGQLKAPYVAVAITE